MKLPQFTLRDMFFATTLIALATWSIVWLVREPDETIGRLPAVGCVGAAFAMACIERERGNLAKHTFYAILIWIVVAFLLIMLVPAVIRGHR